MIERLLAGDAALERGDLEGADRLFTQVAEADPRNAIAVVGLARVAVRRGEGERARALANRALAMDPKEAAARRLITDLDRQPVPTPLAAPRAEPVRAAEPETVAGPEPGRPLESGPGRPLEPWPAPMPEAAAVLRAEPASPRGGWRGWLDRLLRRH